MALSQQRCAGKALPADAAMPNFINLACVRQDVLWLLQGACRHIVVLLLQHSQLTAREFEALSSQ